MLNPFFLAAADTVSAEASDGLVQKITVLLEGFGVNGPSLLAMVINFTLVAFLLWNFAFKKVLATMEERQKKIEDGLQYAEEMKSKLADTEKHYAEKMREAQAEAGRIVEEARAVAVKFEEDQRQEAVTRAEDIVRRANEATELERKKMLEEVRAEVAQLVVATSAKVLQQELSAEEKSKLSSAAARELAAN